MALLKENLFNSALTSTRDPFKMRQIKFIPGRFWRREDTFKIEYSDRPPGFYDVLRAARGLPCWTRDHIGSVREPKILLLADLSLSDNNLRKVMLELLNIEPQPFEIKCFMNDSLETLTKETLIELIDVDAVIEEDRGTTFKIGIGSKDAFVRALKYIGIIDPKKYLFVGCYDLTQLTSESRLTPFLNNYSNNISQVNFILREFFPKTEVIYGDYNAGELPDGFQSTFSDLNVSFRAKKFNTSDATLPENNIDSLEEVHLQGFEYEARGMPAGMGEFLKSTQVKILSLSSYSWEPDAIPSSLNRLENIRISSCKNSWALLQSLCNASGSHLKRIEISSGGDNLSNHLEFNELANLSLINISPDILNLDIMSKLFRASQASLHTCIITSYHGVQGRFNMLEASLPELKKIDFIGGVHVEFIRSLLLAANQVETLNFNLGWEEDRQAGYIKGPLTEKLLTIITELCPKIKHITLVEMSIKWETFHAMCLLATDLESVDISSCQFLPQKNQTIHPAPFPKLSKIHLPYKKLSVSLLTALCASAPNLNSLDLSWIDIITSDAASLNLENIQSITLSSYDLEFAKTIDKISPNLSSITIAHVDLYLEKLIELCAAFSSMRHLTLKSCTVTNDPDHASKGNQLDQLISIEIDRSEMSSSINFVVLMGLCHQAKNIERISFKGGGIGKDDLAFEDFIEWCNQSANFKQLSFDGHAICSAHMEYLNHKVTPKKLSLKNMNVYCESYKGNLRLLKSLSMKNHAINSLAFHQGTFQDMVSEHGAPAFASNLLQLLKDVPGLLSIQGLKNKFINQYIDPIKYFEPYMHLFSEYKKPQKIKKGRLDRDSSCSPATPARHDLEENFNTKKPPRFVYNGHIKSLNQTMIINQLSQYLTIKGMQLDLIPKIQPGICEDLALLFLDTQAADFHHLLKTMVSWNGRAESLNDELEDIFQRITQRIINHKERDTSIFIGDRVQDIFDNPEPDLAYILSNPWHAIAVRYKSDHTWELYDSNHEAGSRNSILSTDLVPLITQELGSLISANSEKEMFVGESILDCNLFLEEGGFIVLHGDLNLFKAFAQHYAETDFTSEALHGLLYRNAKAKAIWVLGLISPAHREFFVDCIKSYVSKNQDAYKNNFEKSLDSLNKKDSALCLSMITEIITTGSLRSATVDVVNTLATSLSEPPPAEYRKPNARDMRKDKLVQTYASIFYRKNTPPASSEAFAREVILSQAKKQLIRTHDGPQHQQCICDIQMAAIKNKVPVFYVGRVEDLYCSRGWITKEVNSSAGIKVNGPAGPLYKYLMADYADAVMPIILINTYAFELQELLSQCINSMLDDTNSVDGVVIPDKFKIVCVQNTQYGKFYNGSDFTSRLGECIRHYTFNASMPALIDDYPAKLGLADMPHHVIDLYNSPHWRARLLGRWQAQGEKFTFIDGEIIAGIKSGRPILIANGPMEDEEYNIFLRMGSLVDQKISGLPINFSAIKHIQGYDFVRLLKGHVFAHVPADFLFTRADYQILNANNLSKFFIDHLKNDSGYMEETLGLLHRCSKRPLKLLVTSYLDEHQWAEFLSMVNKLLITLEVAILPSIELPYLIESIMPKGFLTPKIALGGGCAKYPLGEKVFISTSDISYTVFQLESHYADVNTYDVNALSFDELFSSFQANSQPLKASSSKAHLILHGQFSQMLLNYLLPIIKDQIHPIILVTDNEKQFIPFGMKRDEIRLEDKLEALAKASAEDVSTILHEKLFPPDELRKLRYSDIHDLLMYQKQHPDNTNILIRPTFVLKDPIEEYQEMLRTAFDFKDISKAMATLAIEKILYGYRFLATNVPDKTLVTPCHIKSIAMLSISQFTNDPRIGFETIIATNLEQVLVGLVPIEHKAQFYASLGLEFSNAKWDQNKAVGNQLVTPSRMRSYRYCSDILELRKFRKVNAVTLNDIQLYGDIALVNLESTPGLGKSQLLIAIMEEHCIGKGDIDSPESQENVYYIVDASLSVDKKNRILHKAYAEGNIIIADEINSGNMQDIKLTDFLLNKIPEGNGNDKKPGFIIFSTQNPVSMEGRRPVSKELQDISFNVILPDYTDSEMNSILTFKGVPEINTEAMIQAYRVHQNKHPTVCFRTLMRVADKHGHTSLDSHKQTPASFFAPARLSPKSNKAATSPQLTIS